MKSQSLALVLLAVVTTAAACSAPPPPAANREFPLTGELLAIKPDKSEIQVKHDEVRGFMEPMTMWFTVKDPRLVDGLAPGDLLSATLVLTAEDSYLTTIRKTGSRPPGEASAPPPAPADILPLGATVPDIAFTDETGQPRPLSSYRGTYTLLTFIYTRCPLPDYCPRMNTHFAAVQRSLKADPALGRSVRLLSVSFDPEFDTPAVLAAKAKAMGADPALWRFVTAPRERVDAFGATLGLAVLREGDDGSNITHNLRTALLDRDGKLARTYNGKEWSPEDVVRDLQALVK
ncbi:MAG: SCO family protein [Vicinamibacterales bacterium]